MVSGEEGFLEVIFFLFLLLSFSNRPKTGKHEPGEMLDLAVEVMGETQQTAPAQINLSSFSSRMSAPTNSPITGKQQPDLTFNSTYFVRKYTRVWEITELQLRETSRTHQAIPLARLPQPE